MIPSEAVTGEVLGGIEARRHDEERKGPHADRGLRQGLPRARSEVEDRAAGNAQDGGAVAAVENALIDEVTAIGGALHLGGGVELKRAAVQLVATVAANGHENRRIEAARLLERSAAARVARKVFVGRGQGTGALQRESPAAGIVAQVERRGRGEARAAEIVGSAAAGAADGEVAGRGVRSARLVERADAVAADVFASGRGQQPAARQIVGPLAAGIHGDGQASGIIDAASLAEGPRSVDPHGFAGRQGAAAERIGPAVGRARSPGSGS